MTKKFLGGLYDNIPSYSDVIKRKKAQEELQRLTNDGTLNVADLNLSEAALVLVTGMDTNPKDLIGATKPPLTLVPAAGLIHCSLAMKNGADKYGAFNWREKKVQTMIYLDATIRHVLSYVDGEEVAEDSGVHHLGHAMACLAILLDAKETGNLIDNRPSKGIAANLIKEKTSNAKKD